MMKVAPSTFTKAPITNDSPTQVVPETPCDSKEIKESRSKKDVVITALLETRKHILEKYVHVMVTYPVWVLLGTAFICILLSVIGVVVGGLPTIENPRTGMQSRGDDLILDILLKDRMYRNTLRRIETRTNNKVFCLANRTTCPLSRNFVTHFPYMYDGGVFLRAKPGVSMWDLESIQEYCEISKTLYQYVTRLWKHSINSNNYKNMFLHERMQLLPVISLLSFAGEKCFPSSIPICSDITKATVDTVRSIIDRCATVRKLHVELKRNCSLVHDILDKECLTQEFHLTFTSLMPENHTNVKFLSIKLPIRQYNYENYHHYEDLISFITSESHKLTRLDLAGVGFNVREEEFNHAIKLDMVYIFIAIIFVAVSTSLYTRSLFYTFAVIVSFIFSIGVSYFIYRIVFGITFFPFINLLSLVLLIGVGADDAFVLEHFWTHTERQLRSSTINSSPVDPSLFNEIAKTAISHAISSMFVTSVTTSAALLVNSVNDVVVIKCFGVFAGLLIITTFLLVIMWLVAAWIIYKKHIQNRYNSLIPICCHNMENKLWTGLELVVNNIFHIYLPWFVYHMRYVLVILLSTLSLVATLAIFHYPAIQIPSTETRLFKDINRPVSYYHFKISQLAYGVPHFNNVTLLWGLERGNLDDLAKFDPEDVGGPLTFSPHVNITARNFLVSVSEVAENFSSLPYVQSKPGSNWVKQYLNWAQTGLAPECYDYISPRCAANFSSIIKPPSMLYYQDNTTIKAIGLKFELTSKPSMAFSYLKKVFKPIQKFQLSVNDQFGIPNPAIDYSPFEQASWYNLLNGLINGLKLSIGISLIIALFAIWITTWNVLGTLLSILAISEILLTVFGCLALMGWELGVVEATLVILAVGVCFDFTLHYAVAFQFTSRYTLREQLQATIGSVGPPVAMAAFTSGVAGLCMFHSQTLPLFQIGVFLVLVISISWIYATFCFLPLILVVCEIKEKFGKSGGDEIADKRTHSC